MASIRLGAACPNPNDNSLHYVVEGVVPFENIGRCFELFSKQMEELVLGRLIALHNKRNGIQVEDITACSLYFNKISIAFHSNYILMIEQWKKDFDLLLKDLSRSDANSKGFNRESFILNSLTRMNNIKSVYLKLISTNVEFIKNKYVELIWNVGVENTHMSAEQLKSLLKSKDLILKNLGKIIRLERSMLTKVFDTISELNQQYIKLILSRQVKDSHSITPLQSHRIGYNFNSLHLKSIQDLQTMHHSELISQHQRYRQWKVSMCVISLSWIGVVGLATFYNWSFNLPIIDRH